MDIAYQVKPHVTNDPLNMLFNASWPTHIETNFQAVLAHSLFYICACQAENVIGFVNVAWDGGIHAFLLDTTVDPAYQKKGIGLQLVNQAITLAHDEGIV